MPRKSPRAIRRIEGGDRDGAKTPREVDYRNSPRAGELRNIMAAAVRCKASSTVPIVRAAHQKRAIDVGFGENASFHLKWGSDVQSAWQQHRFQWPANETAR